MIRIALVLAAALLAFPAAAQDAPVPELSLEQTMQLRCAAAFAVVADQQRRGVNSEPAYPPLEVRGKEFAVRAGARLMDELKLSREQYRALFAAQVEALQTQSGQAGDPNALLHSVMPPCLSALGASRL